MILLVGKTCSGKDTIRKELIKLGMNSVVTYTTRPPRDGEINGITYHFISKEDFFEKEQKGFFAETTSYNVASGDTWYYGSAVEDLTEDKVIIVNPYGLKQIKKIQSLKPVSFYLKTSEKTIIKRLKKRGDAMDEGIRRLSRDNKDFQYVHNSVDFMFSNDKGLPSKTLEKIILSTYKKVNEVMGN